MTLVEGHMLAKESQIKRVSESDSFASIMTLLWDGLTPFIFSVMGISLGNRDNKLRGTYRTI